MLSSVCPEFFNEMIFLCKLHSLKIFACLSFSYFLSKLDLRSVANLAPGQ